MDAYELPEEFAHLQAQDMSKLGFMQDLIRGIRKIIRTDEPKTTVVKETIVRETGSASNNVNTESLLRRAFMFLEDENWNSADEYCEKVLDLDPESARAYLGKLMSALHVKKQEDLADCNESFENNGNYQKALRFGDEKLRAALKEYINETNRKIDIRRKDAVYSSGKSKMSDYKISNYEAAIETFETISGWRDADKQIAVCKDKIEEIKAKEEELRIAIEKATKRRNKIVAITVLILCSVVAFCVIFISVIILNNKKSSYNSAIALMDDGKYEEAISVFESLNGFKDSEVQIENCNISRYGEEKWNNIKNINIGDTYTFGAYEQDNDTKNGQEDIEWTVLAKDGAKILVVSKYALDCKQYDTTSTNVTWETCTLRKWLNNDFINAAFSANEKAMIPTVTVSADKNPLHSTDPGNATQDQVFLLSITEANKYFNSNSARQCKPTDYAGANGAWTNLSSNCWWWLRSPGYSQACAARVSYHGIVNRDGCNVDYAYCNAVRPALWIDLAS